MGYLLDTNTCIAFFKSNPSVTAKIHKVGLKNVNLCAPVKAELWYGACNSERMVENQARLREFFSQVISLPFDDQSIEHYGEIRAILKKAGTPIGANDLLIAAIARAHGLIVVTNNIREFERVPLLKIENWHALS